MGTFNFKETIHANVCYKIFKLSTILEKETNEAFKEICIIQSNDYSDSVVTDGDRFVMVCQKRSWEDFKDEWIDGDNEGASLEEMFITRKGNKVIYWRDVETGEDFITIYKEGDETNA